MQVTLKTHASLYQAMDCTAGPKLRETDVAIKGLVEIRGQAKWLAVVDGISVTRQGLAVMTLFYGFPRYLFLDDLERAGAELPTSISLAVSA